jgi:O-antigen ligase
LHIPSTHFAGIRRRPSELGLPALLVAVLAILLLAPLAGAVGSIRPLLLEGLALALFAVALARTQPGSLLQRVGQVLRAGPNLPLLLLVVYALVSSRLAPYKGFANSEWLRLAGGVTLYFVAAYATQTRDRFRSVVDGVIAVVLLGTLMEFARYAHSDNPMSAVFGNRQLLASFLLLAMPLLLTVSLVARNTRRKMVAQVAFIVVAAGLMMAQTRSAWAGALVSLAVLGTVYALRTGGLKQLARGKHRAALILVPVLGAVGLFVAVSLTSPALSARLSSLGTLASDTTLAWRLHQWSGTWEMIARHPWFGWGLGSYAVAINQFVPDSTPLDMLLRSGANLTQNAHNLYLQMLAELGILGTALYLWVLGAFFFTGFRALRRQESPSRFAVLAACLAAVAGQMVDALANPAYQFGEVSLFFWLILGIGMAAAGIAPQPAAAAAADTVATSRRRGFAPRLAWQGAMLSVACMVVGSGLALGQNFLPAEPIYLQLSRFDLTARSGTTGLQPGYRTPTVMSGECIEVQVAIQFVGSEVYDAERSPFLTYTIGGTAPAGCVVQQPAPNQNVFCVPVTAGAECNGKTADITATYVFRGQVLTRTASFNILGATCGLAATVDRPVLPATGNLETVVVTFPNPPANPAAAPMLRRVEIYPDVTLNRPGDVVPGANNTFQLRATAGRTYVLVFKTCDEFNRTCYLRLTVLVSSRTTFEPAPEPKPVDVPKPGEVPPVTTPTEPTVPTGTL